MRDAINRIAVVSLVVVLAVMSVVAPITGTAVADDSDQTESTQKCDDPKTYWHNGRCVVTYGQIDGQTAEEVHYSIFASGLKMEDHWQRDTVETQSHINETTGIMTSEGVYAAIEAYNDGASVAEAQQKGIGGINDFASKYQKAVYHDQTAQVEQIGQMLEEINGTSGLTRGDVFVRFLGDWEYAQQTRNATLWNGTNVSVTQGFMVDTYTTGNPNDDRYLAYYGQTGGSITPSWNQTKYNISYAEWDDTDPFDDVDDRQPLEFNMVSPTGETIIVVNADEYQTTISHIDDRRRLAIDNMIEYIEWHAQHYDRGELTVQDYKSPSERMRTVATDFGSTGHYAYAQSAAYQMGYSTDIGAAFKVRYEDNGTWTNASWGAFYADTGAFRSYNGSIQTGVVYNASELNGSVYFEPAESTDRVVFNGTDRFEITGMKNLTNGDTINQTTLEDNSFKTEDPEDYKQNIDNWSRDWDDYQQVQREITVDSPTVTLPSIGDDAGDLKTAGIAIFAVLALIAIASVIGAIRPR